MIKSFKHKGLQAFYETGSVKGIQSEHAKKIRMRLVALDTAISIEDLDLPGFRLHLLQGSREGVWSIRVSGNRRLTFTFIEGDVYILNYEDYH